MTTKPTPDGPISDETIEKQHADAARLHTEAILALPSNYDALQVEHAHTHDTAGEPLTLAVAHPAAVPCIPGCGRLIAPGAHPSAHAIGCEHHAPHPDSIAAQVPRAYWPAPGTAQTATS